MGWSVREFATSLGAETLNGLVMVSYINHLREEGRELEVAVKEGAEARMKITDLPPAAQKALRERSSEAKIEGVSKEIAQGKTVYEVEFLAGAIAKALVFDADPPARSCSHSRGIRTRSTRRLLAGREAAGDCGLWSHTKAGSWQRFESKFSTSLIFDYPSPCRFGSIQNPRIGS